MSFVVALSNMRVEGLMASTTSIISKSFCLFIKDLKEAYNRYDYQNNKTYFIFDNCSLHRSKDFKQFAYEHSVRWISIPPYTPQLNPAEKIIAVIKSKIRKQWECSKVMSLDRIKTIVDDIEEITWRKWVKSSLVESFKLMRHMKNS